MQMGVGSETITHQGQLTLPVTFTYNGIVARNQPVYWGVTDDESGAALSRSRDVIANGLGLSVCGVTVPDADLTVAVPTAVFDAIPALNPGEDVAFVLTTRLARAGGVLVTAKRVEREDDSRWG